MNQRHERRLSSQQETLLDFYFASGRLFYRSTLGAQLDRAMMLRRTSSGAVVGRAPHWHWRPGDQAPPIYVANHVEATGYEVDPRDLVAHSRLSRRMNVLARSNPLAYAVLSIYYGDAGARWARTSQDRFDEADPFRKPIARGLGLGAIMALYPFTPSGGELLRREARTGVLGGRSSQRREEKRIRRALLADHEARLGKIDETTTTLTADLAAAHAAAAEAVSEEEAAGAEYRRSRGGGDGPATYKARVARAAARRRAAEARARAADIERELLLLRRHRAHLSVPTELASPQVDLQARAGWATYMQLLEEHASMCKVAAERGEPLPTPPEAPAAGAARLPVVGAPREEREDLTVNELLEVALLLQARSPSEIRRQLLNRAQEQAMGLLHRAWDAWEATAAPRNKAA